MAEFLKSQLDYIYFFYGSAFLLLFPICLFLRRRSYRKLPWIWLGWFGALHGTNEGLDLLAMSLEPGPAFDYVRLGVLVMSFVCLAEFGRAGTRIICGRGPGRWVLVVMVALAGVGGLAGFGGLFAATRYVLGLIGGIWAAGALFLAARTEPSGSHALKMGALGLMGYGLATGLVVPPVPFFPAAWLNYDSFFAVTGVPIQLIRGLLVVWVSASLGFFAQACLDVEKDYPLRNGFRTLIKGAMAGMTLIVIGGWLITQHLGDIAASLQHRSQGRLLGISLSLLLSVLFTGFIAIITIMRENEASFRQLFENAADSLLLHDKGRIIKVNRQACRSLGYTREELLGMSLFDIEVGYDKKFLIDLWEKGEDAVTLSGIYRRKDGLTFATEIKAGGITYRGQTLRLAAARDVSARKQAEEALQESEKYYRSLFNNMLNGYAYCQMYFEHGRPVDFIFLNVNKAFGDLTGLKDVIGKKISEAIPGIRESDPEFLEMCGKVALTGIPKRAEIYVESLKMWFSISVFSPLKEYFVAIFDVITERKLAEDALREREAKYRGVVETSADGFCITDMAGRFLEFNDAYTGLLGFSREELLTMNVGDIEAQNTPAEIAATIEKVRSAGHAVFETKYRSKDGRIWPAEVNLSYWPIAGGRFFVFVRDITSRKMAEEALRTSEEALRQGQESYRNLAGQLLTAQEAERKRLARELHDDLSQRLAGLAMEAEMLEQKMPPHGVGAVRLKEMKDKLVTLSIDVHSMSRQLHPSILDDLGLPDAIASECDRFRRKDSLEVDFRAENITQEIPPDVAVCLYRIAQEGLRNISRHGGATEVTISLVGKNDTIRLTITDNGRGFDPGRVKGKHGLGLDSMKERAYLIGGDFSLESQPGQGTVIEVLVPLSRSPL